MLCPLTTTASRKASSMALSSPGVMSAPDLDSESLSLAAESASSGR